MVRPTDAQARRLRMALDYLGGVSMADIARAEGVSGARVYQLIDATIKAYLGHGWTPKTAKLMGQQTIDRMSQIARAMRLPRAAPAVATTPEEFYVEVENEKKTRTLL